jgi:hypothetical protein
VPARLDETFDDLVALVDELGRDLSAGSRAPAAVALPAARPQRRRRERRVHAPLRLAPAGRGASAPRLRYTVRPLLPTLRTALVLLAVLALMVALELTIIQSVGPSP